ncbi:MAG: lamin tail domain-containing protein, partial [Phycisphaerales bacterium]
MRVTRLLAGLMVFVMVVLGAGPDRSQEAWGQDTATAVINEFMATNGSVAPLGAGEILDADGDSSDWIEIRNPSGATLDLSGWYLTDDADDLTRWRFPDGVTLDRGGFLLVFASGKDRTGSELHTNFKLSADGEYLALVAADGTTVVHEYEPRYPEQLTGVSYGLGRHGGRFVTPGSLASYRVPGATDADMTWTTVAFDDADWSTAATGLGFAPVAELTHRDIGNPRAPGSSFVDGGTYIVQGIGNDIGGTRDTFHFVYAPLRGDGELTANVAGMITANEWSKAGVMIRETLDSGARYAAEMLTHGNGVVYQARATTNGSSISAGGNEHGVPLQVRIIRRGDAFSGYYSLDGINWIQQSSETIDMGPDAYIGLCVTSHSSVTPCTAVFDGLMFGSRENNTLREQMLGSSGSLWARVEFDADETDFFDALQLKMQYEDGFVAFLNGVEVARDNFTGAPDWASVADSDRPDGLRAEPKPFDLSDQKDLLRDGRNVLAIAALNDDVADETFFVSAELTASGDVVVPQYFVTPTPGQVNSAGPLDIVAAPVPSHPRGLYEAPFALTFSCDTPAATIRYTTDGTDPTQTSGMTYDGPIQVDGTMCLKVAAFRPGWMASEIQSHTYIFLDQVLEQPRDPAGMPSRWGSTTADYEMDPDIVNNPAYGPSLKAGLMSLPTMSLVVRADDLFGNNGIYTNWNSSGDAWERPASMELIYPDGREGFQVNCGIRIYGGVGRREPKKSFRLQFTRDYGPTKLHYALFGDDAVDRFDQIILRANFNDAYTWGGNRSQYIRDEYVRRL